MLGDERVHHVLRGRALRIERGNNGSGGGAHAAGTNVRFFAGIEFRVDRQAVFEIVYPDVGGFAKADCAEGGR